MSGISVAFDGKQPKPLRPYVAMDFGRFNSEQWTQFQDQFPSTVAEWRMHLAGQAVNNLKFPIASPLSDEIPVSRQEVHLLEEHIFERWTGIWEVK